ncbi:hypothetical protein LPN04_23290 [Rugamonas sp. A1-17]|nr:hypothetical protein [Rugamonas sp. A1-17]
MKDLDAINPAFAKPSSFVSVTAALPLIISACCLALANGAAESVPLQQNPISILCILIAGLSFVLLFLPRILKWDWRARYFGVSTLYMASVAMFGGIPWLCILFYSSAPIFLRGLLFLSYVYLLAYWGFRFVNLYRYIYVDTKMRAQIYQEDVDCIYYLQKGDTALLGKRLKFKQFPPSILFVLFGIAACLTIIFGKSLVAFFGLPVVHLFLAVGAIPLDMLAIGLAVRGWMIFYCLPARLNRELGKQVYVDLVAKLK